MKNSCFKVFLAGLWITFSEFLRNELLFKHYWVSHYEKLGLSFQTFPLNGILWMIWSFLLAYVLHRLEKHLCLWEAVGLTWLAAFLMMWLVMYNLQVLPFGLLWFAVPLSLVEVIIAGWIVKERHQT